MAAATNQKNLIVGIVLIVLGALVLLGRLSVGDIIPYLGIALVVVGILMVLSVLAGGTLIGIIVLVIGILLLVRFIPEPNIPVGVRRLFDVVDLVLGIVLVVLGILKVLGKR